MTVKSTMKKWQQTILTWDFRGVMPDLEARTNILLQGKPGEFHGSGPHYLNLSWLKIYTANYPNSMMFVQPLFWTTEIMNEHAHQCAHDRLTEAVGRGVMRYEQPVLISDNGSACTYEDSMILGRPLRSGEEFCGAAMKTAIQFFRGIGLVMAQSIFAHVFSIHQRTWIREKTPDQPATWVPFRRYLLDNYPLYPVSQLERHSLRF